MPRPIPLIFGVSGHRDLLVADAPQLREQLYQIFARFRAAYPHTPFRLLTPLAEGADRLAAEVALASKISLFVPLPMEQQEYEQDFTTAESLAEFRALLAMAKSHWEIPIAPTAGVESRIRQYAEVGDFIARHSNVLILLWDGCHNRKVGGTAWVKKRREYWVNTTSDPFRDIALLGYAPTIQVVTPRASGRLPRPRPATIGELPPSAVEFAATLSKRRSSKGGGERQKGPPLYQRVYWAINSFNADVQKHVPPLGTGSMRMPLTHGAVGNRRKRQSATRSRL